MIRAITLSALLAGLFVQSADAATFKFGDTRVQVSLPKGCRALSCLSLSLAQASRPRLGKERRSQGATREAVETRPRRNQLPQAPDATVPTPAPIGAPTLAPMPTSTRAPAPTRAPTLAPMPTITQAPAPTRAPTLAPIPTITQAPAPTRPPTLLPTPTRVATPAPITPVVPRLPHEAQTLAVPVPNRADVPQPSTFAPPTTPKSPPPEVTRADDVSSPVGYWRTEKHEGQVHIVECGAKLCGYAFDARKGTDGEQVLIGMKPVNGKTWRGKIHDTRGYGTYDSTIALKGPASLRVQGCAFGGFFCGGQTWTRL